MITQLFCKISACPFVRPHVTDENFFFYLSTLRYTDTNKAPAENSTAYNSLDNFTIMRNGNLRRHCDVHSIELCNMTGIKRHILEINTENTSWTCETTLKCISDVTEGRGRVRLGLPWRSFVSEMLRGRPAATRHDCEVPTEVEEFSSDEDDRPCDEDPSFVSLLLLLLLLLL